MAVAGVTNSEYCHKHISLATTNPVLVRGGPCWFMGYSVGNLNAAPVYLKIYDKATAPTVGTDTPVFVVMIPGNAAGSGANVEFSHGIYMENGLGFGLAAGMADNSTTAVSAGEQIINIVYKKN